MHHELFTIGHSNLPRDRFVDLLIQHHIKALVDVRRFPSSRSFPHFNQSSLESALHEAGIEYHWLEALGGRRHKVKGDSSRNMGLENASFRNYADYMLTREFATAIGQLEKIAVHKRTSIMCAEAVFWRCHRRLISDFLLAEGWRVQHIMPNGDLRAHTLTRGGSIENGQVTYPGEASLFT